MFCAFTGKVVLQATSNALSVTVSVPRLVICLAGSMELLLPPSANYWRRGMTVESIDE